MSTDTGKPPKAQEIADRLAIQDILYCHSRGLDRQDSTLLQACYWPDAEVDYGAYKGPALQFVELVLPALQATYELTRHCLSNTTIAVQGEQACSESYVNAAHLLQGAQEEMSFAGRYLDRLEKRHGEWKIVHRLVVMDWSLRHHVKDERTAQAFADLAKGGHGDNDPLAGFLTDTGGQ